MGPGQNVRELHEKDQRGKGSNPTSDLLTEASFTSGFQLKTEQRVSGVFSHQFSVYQINSVNRMLFLIDCNLNFFEPD